MSTCSVAEAGRDVKGLGTFVSEPDLVRLSDVSPVPVRWLWPGRIPRGKITLLSGDPGLGKSLCTIDWAARTTQGLTWPDDPHTRIDGGSVIFLTGEHDVADTLRPRLDAAGANVSRVLLLRSVVSYDAKAKRESREFFSLAKDLPALAKAITQSGDCRLVVIDPVGAYLDGVDAHKNSEVRRVLGPLAELLAETGVAGVLVDHFNKSSGMGKKALYRSMGSIAFTAGPRAAWCVTRDKENPTRRLMLSMKNNLVADTIGGLAYSILPDPNGVPVIEWEPNPIHISADDAIAPPEPRRDAAQLRRAKEWLEGLLHGGPVECEQVKAQAQTDGLSWATVRRADRDLGIRHRRQGFGPGVPWVWELPSGGRDEWATAHDLST